MRVNTLTTLQQIEDWVLRLSYDNLVPNNCVLEVQVNKSDYIDIVNELESRITYKIVDRGFVFSQFIQYQTRSGVKVRIINTDFKTKTNE